MLRIMSAMLLAVTLPAAGQEPAGEARRPTLLEVPARAQVLADSALEAERALGRLGTTAGLETELAEARTRQADVQALLAALAETDYVRPERLSRLRDQAVLEEQRLDALRARMAARLAQLAELSGRWTQQQHAWSAAREELGVEPAYETVRPELDLVDERIDRVLVAASAAAGRLLQLQREVEALRGENEQVAGAVTAIRLERRRALLQREPVLLSAAHRGQLAEGGWRAWRPDAVLRPGPYLAFLRAHPGLIALHALLALALALLARHARRWALADEPWTGLLEHPWLLGVAGSTVLALQRVLLAPPLWDVLLWVVFGAAAAVLGRRVLPTTALRLTLYLLAAFYPVFLLLEVLQLPAPVFRLGLASVAAGALPVFSLLARRRGAAARAVGSTDPRRIWPLRIGAAMWGVVLVAVVLGYDALGRWILHASVTSAAVVFVVVVLLALIRGAVAALLRTAEAGRGRFLRQAGVRVARRLIVLVKIVLVIAAGLIILDVWEIAASPIATWQRIANLGFGIGALRITVGRLLLGALVIYFAVLISGLMRTFAESDVYRRWEMDRGVGESISRLVHYALITIGVVLALAVMGVELQNFAIVAGALGIGIGFGLQNVVNNFASGLILLFERPVRVGDTVVVNDVWGTIQKIGLRSTIMLTFDQSEMIVPNADLVSEKVTNWTLSSPIARVIIPVSAAYGSPVERVLGILREAGLAHAAVLRQPPPQAIFTDFGDSSLDFELRVWVTDIRQRLEVRSRVLAEVERRFAEADIEIPFPQRDLHVRSVDPAVLTSFSPRPDVD
jgi:potassium-dependent mechanosensitive channel